MSVRSMWVALGLALVVSSACTEDALFNPGPGAPGATSETFEIRLGVSELAEFRDTTFSGFAVPTNAPFTVAINQPLRQARPLIRFNLPDTIIAFGDTLPADTFVTADILVRLDTLRSDLSGLPVTFSLRSLNRSFDDDSVTWLQADAGVPWTTPGGDVGQELASAMLTAGSDSLIFDLDAVADSLLSAWRADDGEPGLIVLTEGSGVSVRMITFTLRSRVILEGRTDEIASPALPATVRTFITDPPTPPPGQALRIGGLPTTRFYLRFRVPETIGGFPTREVQINHAQLVLRPLPPPPDPFAIEATVTTRPIQLLADPFVFGARTPVGGSPVQFTLLNPDSLAAGIPIRVDVTRALNSAVFAEDTVSSVSIGLRGDPDVQTLGFWEFGSRETPGFEPELLLIVTPTPDFDQP